MTGPVRRYAALSALRWLPVGLIVPVLVLLAQARGLDLAATGRLLALYSAVTLLLELPTGGLADVIGRRPVLISSSVASAVGAALFAVGTSQSVLVIAVVCSAVGRALGSGPLEAWYVDLTRADDDAADIRHGLAAGQMAEAAALGVGALLGGALPIWASSLRPSPAPLAGIGLTTVIPLSVPFLLSAVLFVAHAIAVLLLVHEPASRSPRAKQRLMASVTTTVRDGARVSLRHPAVRRLMLFTAVFGFTLSGVELLTPGHVATLLGSAERGSAVYGVLIAVSFGANALGAWLAPRLVPPGRRDPRRWAMGVNLASAIAVCIVGAPFIGSVAVALTATYLFIGVAGPLIAEMLHDRVSDSMRSTILSVQSLTLQAGGLVASLLIGGLAERAGLWPAFLLIGLVLALGSLLLPKPDAHAQPQSPN